jgi:hypothetical protein
MADIYAGKGTFRFEHGEYMKLAQLASKHGTDIATILRIGGNLMIEADERGLLKIKERIDPASLLRRGD